MERSRPPPVVDMKRHSRLYPPEPPMFEWSMMNFCIVVIFIAFVMMWMRATEIRRMRDFSTRRDVDPAPSALPG